MPSHATRQIEAAFETFAARIDLEGFAFDPEGNAVLAFDEVLVDFQILDGDGVLLVMSRLGAPPLDSADLYGRLLDANFLWSGTGGATIARDPDGSDIVLMRRIPGDGLTAETLEEAVGTFVSVAEAFMAEIAGGDSYTESSGDDLIADRHAIRI